MSKLDLVPRVPAQYERQTFADIIRAICNQVNPLSEGRLAARYNAQTTVPSGTAVSYAAGDFVPDSNCAVTGGSIRLGWVCTASGTPGTLKEARVIVADFAPITNSLSGDVALNNTANYFDGPSIAQGTSGTWFVSGTVTPSDGAAADMFVKLWDGTTVIASSRQIQVAASNVSISLSGVITNPAGNLRISVRDASTTGGKILFNSSGNSKDSTITAFRIA